METGGATPGRRFDAWHAKAAVVILAFAAALAAIAAPAFMRGNPNSAFSAMASGADRIVVSEGPMAEGEPESVSISDAATIRSISGAFRFDSTGVSGFLRCRCAGHHRIEFFEGEEMLASMTVHHGTKVRWNRFKGDSPLTIDARASLSEKLTALGLMPFPAESGH